MTYHDRYTGRVGDEASDAGRITFEGVVERLVEAWGFMWRMPDREAGWLRAPSAGAIYQRGQLSRQELWALYQVDSDDYDRDALPKLPGLRTAEVDRMEEALGWVEWVDPAHRRLVGMVLQSMHRGDDAQVQWTGIAKRLGWAGHPDTLAKRWSRAIFRIAQRLEKAKNGGNAHLGGVNPSNALGVK
jgi:hypothetical protein